MVNFYTKKICVATILVLVFSACNSVKNLTDFQRSKRFTDTLTVAKRFIPKIQPGDIISINVSSLSNEASSFFNPYNGLGVVGVGVNSNSGGVNQTPGYLVDPSGYIQYPLIGNIKVAGLTTTEIRDTMLTRLKNFVREPTVIVRYLNFKITFLGELGRVEVVNVPNESITLPEAISLSGDVTAYAQRDSVMVIRDVGEKKVVGYVDLTSREVFNSPYYYLHPNDIVYVKPSRFKAQHNDRFFTLFSFGTGVLSLLLFLFRK